MRPTDIGQKVIFSLFCFKISLIVFAGTTVDKSLCLFLKFAIEL
jgi:hypothetical protein